MRVEVDQSGKIETLTVDTALAFSDGIVASILIPAAVKRKIYRQLKKSGVRRKMITIRMFTAGLFLLLENHLGDITRVIIDVEYEGWDAEIRGLLLAYIRQAPLHLYKDQIDFGCVGKKSQAHKVALEVFRKAREPGKRITVREMLDLC